MAELNVSTAIRLTTDHNDTIALDATSGRTSSIARLYVCELGAYDDGGKFANLYLSERDLDGLERAIAMFRKNNSGAQS